MTSLKKTTQTVRRFNEIAIAAISITISIKISIMIGEDKLLAMRNVLRHALRVLYPAAAAVNYGYLMFWLITGDHRDLAHLMTTVSFYGLFGVVLLLGLVGLRNHELDKVGYCAILTSVAIVCYAIWFHIQCKAYIVAVAVVINVITYVFVIMSMKLIAFARHGQ